MGAALAYYTLFSIAPLLLVVIAIAGAAFGEDQARMAVMQPIGDLLGADASAAIESLLQSARVHGDGASRWWSLALLVMGATTVFAELRDALDRIWRVPGRVVTGKAWARLLRTRLLSFGLVVAMGFLLLVSLVASAVLAAWSQWWAPVFGGVAAALQAADLVLGFAITTGLFALVYKFVPTTPIAWRDVILGASVTAVLFGIGKTLIGLYIGRSGVASGFGAASALVALLVWVYMSAQIFLFGAELTWAYARRLGSRAKER